MCMTLPKYIDMTLVGYNNLVYDLLRVYGYDLGRAYVYDLASLYWYDLVETQWYYIKNKRNKM